MIMPVNHTVEQRVMDTMINLTQVTIDQLPTHTTIKSIIHYFSFFIFASWYNYTAKSVLT